MAPEKPLTVDTTGCAPYPSEDRLTVVALVEDPWLDRVRPWGAPTDNGSNLAAVGLLARPLTEGGHQMIVSSKVLPEERPQLVVDLLCLALWLDVPGDDAGAEAWLMVDGADLHGTNCCRMFAYDGQVWSLMTAMLSPWEDNVADWREAYEAQRRNAYSGS